MVGEQRLVEIGNDGVHGGVVSWQQHFFLSNAFMASARCGRPTAFETYLGQRPGRRP